VKKTHIGTGILLIPVCLWLLFWLIPNNTITPTSEHDLSSALMPSIAIGTILLTSVMMLVRALRSSATGAQAMDDEFGEDASGINRGVLLKTLLWAVAATVSWLLITYVAFEPAMTVLLIATMLYIGVRKPLAIVLTSVLMPIILSQASWHFFSTQMPGFWR
jgi:hypothetical protein